jgi:hypothetical protein
VNAIPEVNERLDDCAIHVRGYIWRYYRTLFVGRPSL